MPVTDLPMQLPIVESQLGALFINNPQVSQGNSNISVCSSDSDAHENLKSHFNERLNDKICTTFKELFSNTNIGSVHKILPKINIHNNEIARFVEDVNIRYGILLNYTQLKVSKIHHLAETFQITTSTSSQPKPQQPHTSQVATTGPSSQTPLPSVREQKV